MVFVRVPIRGQGFDQLMRDLHLRIFQLNLRCAKSVHLAHLVGVIHRVQHHAAFVRAQEDRVFAVVHGEFGDGHVFAFFECLGEQRIRPTAGFFRQHVIGRLEVHGIDFALLHELQNFHGFRGLGLDLLYLIRFDDHVLILAILVALNNFAAVHHAIVGRTVVLLLDPLQVVAVQHVEGNAGTARTGKKTHRHGDQAESEIPGPDRGRHKFSPNRNPVRYAARVSLDYNRGFGCRKTGPCNPR